ncbi:MAG: PDZ domain-containing protein [Pirellulaceae bacterium]|nr:PDZ domain-containing protein [Pirellulaceae bacterium]
MIPRSIAFSILSLLCALLAGGQTLAEDSQQSALAASSTQDASLGIGVSPLPEVLKSHLPEVTDHGRGILISEVMAGSPAESAGLKKHDILVRYDDQDLYSPEQLVTRVRRDNPGNTVELQFVRAGKLQSTKVELGGQKKKLPVFSEWNWPGFVNRFDIPWAPLRPEYWMESQDVEGDATEWTSFESLTIQKVPGGQYIVRITYKDTSGNSISNEFKGTRQAIRDAINADNDLPETRKNLLLRTLHDGGQKPLDALSWERTPRALFNWPGVNF